jgi:uncharacterized protein (DUF2236 family)
MSSYTSATELRQLISTNKSTNLEGKYGRYYDPVEDPAEMKAIVGENISMEGGVAAVLLQIAHAPVGKAVAIHSDFQYRRIERARRSIVYIYCMTFGTTEEKRLITDATHKAHSRVKGLNYDANDIEAQLWVAATIYWSLVKSYENVFGKLEKERADHIYKEFSVMATALRVQPELWPTDRAAFKIYWDDMIDKLVVTKEAKGVAKDVLDPSSSKGIPFTAWLYFSCKRPITRIVTTEMLPERIRNEFNLPSTAYSRQMFRLFNGFNAMLIPYMPVVFREWLKNYYMADLRKRIAAGSRL